MKRIVLLLICGLPVFTVWPADDNQARNQKIEQMFSVYQKQFPNVPVVDAQGLIQLRHKPKTLLVDVRTAAEQKVSMIPEAVTQNEFEEKVKNYRSFKIIVYCTIGYRSGLYAAKLREKGFDAYNLKGGVLAWASSHQRFLDPKGQETKKVHVYGPKWNLMPKGYDSVW